MTGEVPNDVSRAPHAGTIMHGEQNGLWASKSAFLQSRLKADAPERSVCEQHQQANAAERENRTSGEVFSDLQRECRASEREECQDPQDDDVASLQAPTQQRTWRIEPSISENGNQYGTHHNARGRMTNQLHVTAVKD